MERLNEQKLKKWRQGNLDRTEREREQGGGDEEGESLGRAEEVDAGPELAQTQ